MAYPHSGEPVYVAQTNHAASLLGEKMYSSTHMCETEVFWERFFWSVFFLKATLKSLHDLDVLQMVSQKKKQ